MGRQEYEHWTNEAQSTLCRYSWETLHNWRSAIKAIEPKYVTLHDGYVHRFMKQDMPLLEAVDKAGKMINEIMARYKERGMKGVDPVPWANRPTQHTTNDDRHYQDHNCINLMTFDDPLAADNTSAVTSRKMEAQ